MKTIEAKYSVVPPRAAQKQLSPADYKVLIVLGAMTNKYGVCWPKHTTIAERCGIEVNTSKKSLMRLVRLKLVRRLKSKHRFQLKTPGRYQILIDPDQPLPSEEEMHEPVGFQRKKMNVEDTQKDEGLGKQVINEREIKRTASIWGRIVQAHTGQVVNPVEIQGQIKELMGQGLTEEKISYLTHTWCEKNPGKLPYSPKNIIVP